MLFLGNGFRSRLVNRVGAQAAIQSPLCKIDERVVGGNRSKETNLGDVSAQGAEWGDQLMIVRRKQGSWEGLYIGSG